MIEENVKKLLEEVRGGNGYGEQVTVVAATKTRSSEEIRRAIGAGITDIGENRVKEFSEKYDLVQGARRHFIGRLQRNKVKYLIGKTFLIHSLDRDELAEEIGLRSLRAGIVSDVLLEINVGAEESKGGYPLSEGYDAFERLAAAKGLRVRGFMAMLPNRDDEALLGDLADRMRALYERARKADPAIEFLSMGMSGDYKLCLKHGANMIRPGTVLFGKR